MAIKIGSNTIDKLYCGSDEIDAIYYGSEKVYEGIQTYSITPTLTNVTAKSDNPTTINTNETKTLIYYTNDNYNLPSTVSVTGATSTWNVETAHTVTATATNATINSGSSYSGFMASGDTITLTLGADGTSYKLPTTITVTGATGTFTRTSDTAGTLVLSNATGNVSFTVSGEAVASGETWIFNDIIYQMFKSNFQSQLTSEYWNNLSLTNVKFLVELDGQGYYDEATELYVDDASGPKRLYITIDAGGASENIDVYDFDGGGWLHSVIIMMNADLVSQITENYPEVVDEMGMNIQTINEDVNATLIYSGSTFSCSSISNDGNALTYIIQGYETIVYEYYNESWLNQDYKTVTFAQGTGSTSNDFKNYLTLNAVKQ